MFTNKTIAIIEGFALHESTHKLYVLSTTGFDYKAKLKEMYGEDKFHDVIGDFNTCDVSTPVQLLQMVESCEGMCVVVDNLNALVANSPFPMWKLRNLTEKLSNLCKERGIHVMV